MLRKGLILIFSLVAAISLRAHAYEFSPIVAQFAPNGPGSARTFVVSNSQSQPVALQLEMFSRSADENGKEVRTPEFDNFIVTPPQLVLAPGQSQSVRVQWVGDPSPAVEKAYRLIVSQLPIPYKRETRGETHVADVKMGIRYEAAVYVVPPRGGPHAEVISSQATTNDAGEKVLRLTVKSSGERRAILQKPSLTVSAGGQSATLEGDAVAALDSKNILAGSQAVFDLPWPDNLPFGPVNTSLETQYMVF
jgi:fimbrial chaperone protein